jgi:hypothetical protein
MVAHVLQCVRNHHNTHDPHTSITNDHERTACVTAVQGWTPTFGLYVAIVEETGICIKDMHSYVRDAAKEACCDLLERMPCRIIAMNHM